MGEVDAAEWAALTSLTKIELIEIALRLGASAVGYADYPRTGVRRVLEEAAGVKEAGITTRRGITAIRACIEGLEDESPE